ncbi:thaumatin [Halteromyces radiatus]|uniref:thaumatin n=1 Tax=Halteromyces radiatus TaxID=101107 RepID=UPI00221F9865|nr:thaumatin [Halteromyces radiatus]KAI8082901.1 thaumatin [Halteromyces radiatus]
MLFSTIASIAALAGMTVASSAGGMQITVKNQCQFDLDVTKLTNGQSSGSTNKVSQGSSQNYPLDEQWQGRFSARQSGSNGSPSDPVSLAEFTFRGAGGNDFYDLSFVDGFNLPLKIAPVNGHGGSNADGQYNCGSPTCSTLPTCPSDMKLTNNGQFSSCQSACAKYKSDEYCCTGANSTPDTCSPNSYSKAVKSDCPDAYSYAYDDKSSTYSCVAEGYDITFCP